MSNKNGIVVDSFGAVGDGVTDDTAAIKKAIAQAIATKQPLILGANTYRVTDTILNEVSKKNISILGQGMDLSILNFSNNDPNKPLIKMELCYYPVLKDFSIIGSSKKGIGIMLGRYNPGGSGDSKWNAVAYGQFQRIKTAGLTTGIHHDAGWINDFFSCNLRDSGTGLKLHGNSINIQSLTCEANDIGVMIINDSQNSTINLLGGCIESNTQVGLKVGGVVHDLNLYGVYFENNPKGHIVAGVDAKDSIETINIVGGSLHYPHPIIFDRVNSLNITGLTEHMTPSPLTITENVKLINIPAFQQNFDTKSTSSIEAIEIKGRNRQSSAPWYLNDFSALTVPTNSSTLTLDTNGQIKIDTINNSILNEYKLDYLTGNKAIQCKLVAGRSHSGMSFTIKPTYLSSDYLSAKIPVFLGSTLDAFRIQVQIRYNLINNSLQTYDTFDYVPAFGGDYGINKVLGKWMSYIVPVNLEPVRKMTNFKSINDVKINVYGTTSKASVGDEWFAVDCIEIYQTKYITEPYNDTRSNLFTPLELTPTTVIAEYFIQGGRKTYYGNAMPTSGSNNQGDYIKNNVPVILGSTGKKYVVKGWIRLTTGSAHVINVDWAEDRSVTGT